MSVSLLDNKKQSPSCFVNYSSHFWRWSEPGLNDTSRHWKYVGAKHKYGKLEAWTIFLWNSEGNQFPFLHTIFELILKFSALHGTLVKSLLKWKVYVIHHFGATIMKLQGTMFLFPSIKSLSSSLQLKTSLGFSLVYTELSLCILPDLFIVLDVWYKNLQSDICSLYLFAITI